MLDPKYLAIAILIGGRVTRFGFETDTKGLDRAEKGLANFNRIANVGVKEGVAQITGYTLQ